MSSFYENARRVLQDRLDSRAVADVPKQSWSRQRSTSSRDLPLPPALCLVATATADQWWRSCASAGQVPPVGMSSRPVIPRRHSGVAVGSPQ